jgi:hypothetical protein
MEEIHSRHERVEKKTGYEELQCYQYMTTVNGLPPARVAVTVAVAD